MVDEVIYIDQLEIRRIQEKYYSIMVDIIIVIIYTTVGMLRMYIVILI